MTVVLGIDGGGTRTSLAIARETGELLGVGIAGPGNFHDAGPVNLQDRLTEALNAAWRDAGVSREKAAACFLGLAGVASEQERREVRDVASLLDLAPEPCLDVDHDLRIALAGGLSGEPGIVLIVGTGSSCYGRTRDGRTWRAGGWGSVLDDRGSCFDLGRQAMIAAVRAQDGRGPATLLSELVREHFQIEDLRDLLARVDRPGVTRAEVAALAPLVTRSARENDRASIDIIEGGVQELAQCVATVAEHLEEERPKLVMSGGLARSGPEYSVPLERAVRAAVSGVRIVEPALPPVLGAVLLALQHMDGPSQEERIRSLRDGSAAR